MGRMKKKKKIEIRREAKRSEGCEVKRQSGKAANLSFGKGVLGSFIGIFALRDWKFIYRMEFGVCWMHSFFNLVYFFCCNGAPVGKRGNYFL
jgi:hypothetical protein